VLIVLKSGSLNLLEPLGPVKAHNGIALIATHLLLCNQNIQPTRSTDRRELVPEFQRHINTV
jgi:hypothetical protein